MHTNEKKIVLKTNKKIQTRKKPKHEQTINRFRKKIVFKKNTRLLLHIFRHAAKAIILFKTKHHTQVKTIKNKKSTKHKRSRRNKYKAKHKTETTN